MYAIHEKLACQERRMAEFEAIVLTRRAGLIARLAQVLRAMIAGAQLRPTYAPSRAGR